MICPQDQILIKLKILMKIIIGIPKLALIKQLIQDNLDEEIKLNNLKNP